MFFDLIDLSKLRRGIIYALVLAAALFFQDLIFARVALLGVRCFFVPAVVAAVGLFEGGGWGGVFGLAAGLCCDMSFTENTVLLTVLLPAVGFFAGFAGKYLVSLRLESFCALGFAALLLTALMQGLKTALFTGAALGPVLLTVLLQALWSLPFTVPVYYAVRGISSRDL